jgi:hypothetical protein
MKSNKQVYIKFFIATLLSALLTYAIGLYGKLPWWSFVPANFLLSIAIIQKPWRAFLSGAMGVGFLWLSLALTIDHQNNHLLSTKVANIFPLKGAYNILIFITFFIGFLLGGLSSLAGSFIRKEK